jgi:hypothetical protein
VHRLEHPHRPLRCGRQGGLPDQRRLLSSEQWAVALATLAPGAHPPRHIRAAGYLMVPLTDIDFRKQDGSGTVLNVNRGAGDASRNKPLTHEVTNVGSQAASLVLLRFKGGTAAAAPASSDSKAKQRRSHRPAAQRVARRLRHRLNEQRRTGAPVGV